MQPVLIYRWVVFLLAAGYCLRTVFLGDWDHFGGPFRFLTIWALFFSFFCASRMLALTQGRSMRRWDGLVSMTSVINMMVVYLYWSLFLNDPTSVTRNGQLSEPYLELYLHALGPLLQAIDALFIHRAFRKPLAGAAWLFGVIAAYILWAETLVRTMNTTPEGSVTSGLPYRFLNALETGDRAVFYASNFAAGLVLLAVFTALGTAIRRWGPAPKAPPAPRDSRDTAA